MFNEDRKIQFLKEKREKAIVPNNIENIFDLAEQTEISIGRDICDWNSDEIIEFFKYYGTSKIQSLIQIHNSLNEYVNWCLMNGLVNDNQNHFAEIDAQVLCKCIDINMFKKEVMTREWLLTFCNQLPNYSDRFIFLGLFEGIPMRDKQLINCTIGDIKGNELYLSDGTKRIISNELRNIMHVASEEDVYVSMGKGMLEYKYITSDGKIIRPFSAKKGAQENLVIAVTQRIRRCCIFAGLDAVIKIKELQESGRIHYIKNMISKYNISYEEAIAERNYRDEHEKIFGKIQSIPVYMSTFGQFYKSS